MGNDHISIKPIQKELLYTKISEAIMQYIRDNRLEAGDKLPSERILAEKFSTSRNSVREALRMLEQDRVIEVRMGSGAYVAAEELEAPFHLKLWKINYMEILDIKSLLEQSVIDELCGNLSPEQLRSLEESLLHMEKAAELGLYLQKEDYVFHRQLRDMSQNKTRTQLIDNLVKILDAYGEGICDPGPIWSQTVPYHRDILRAIAANDPAAAREAYGKICQIDKKALELQQKIMEKSG